METKRYDSSSANRVLAAMALDDVVCTRIASQWTQEGLFESPWSNLVGSWCVNHARRYGKAPSSHLTSIFEEWSAKKIADDKMINSVERFLYYLSDNYGDPAELGSSEYLLNLAGEYFSKISLQRHIDNLTSELERGNVKKVEEDWFKYRTVNLGEDSYLEPANDANIHIQALSNDNDKPLVSYKGKLGLFIGSSLKRGSLHSFMAPDKSGKSTLLVDLAYRALRNRNRVAFFDTGDSNEREVIVRFDKRLLSSPDTNGKYMIPVRWEEGELIRAEKELEAVDPIMAFRKMKKITKSPDALRLSCHANSTISATDIDGILNQWDREGWRPDVVVVDYADILAPPKGFRDTIDQIDETWKQLRKMSQNRQCLVVTATQVSATAYGKEDGLLSRKHFSGRKTKLAHVNGMLGINVSPEEKEKGVCRINWIVRRDDHYNESSYVRIAGNMAIGCPAIISC
jgi:hypothetical protein